MDCRSPSRGRHVKDQVLSSQFAAPPEALKLKRFSPKSWRLGVLCSNMLIAAAVCLSPHLYDFTAGSLLYSHAKHSTLTWGRNQYIINFGNKYRQSISIKKMSITFPPEPLAKLAHEVAALLKERKESVSVAETAAGGLISSAILATPGASTIYKGR